MLAVKLAVFVSAALLVSGLEDTKVQSLEGTNSLKSSNLKASIGDFPTCASRWSCYDCNQRMYCAEGPQWVFMKKEQCPTWVPYCKVNPSGLALCQASAPEGCGEPTN